MSKSTSPCCEAPKLNWEKLERVQSLSGRSIKVNKNTFWYVHCTACGGWQRIALTCSLPWNKDARSFTQLMRWASGIEQKVMERKAAEAAAEQEAA